MDATIPLYILNVILIAVTVYRAWIEKQDLDGKRKIEKLKVILEREVDTIKGLSGEEFIEMLQTFVN